MKVFSKKINGNLEFSLENDNLEKTDTHKRLFQFGTRVTTTFT